MVEATPHKYWVQTEEMGNTQFKMILIHNLRDGVRPILEWLELHAGGYEAFFLQMQPHLITDLKLVWNLMLVMSFLILGVRFLQNIMNLLLDVLDLFNNFGFSIRLILNMGIITSMVTNA